MLGTALPILIVAAGFPPRPLLSEGKHACGDHWNGYDAVCTVTPGKDGWQLASEGPTSKLSGRMELLADDVFLLHGTVEYGRGPLGISDLNDCAEVGPYAFRRMGKRKYFRHVRTCKDMTTFYFDVFLAPLAKEASAPRVALSALTGGFAFTLPWTAEAVCKPLSEVPPGSLEVSCQRYGAAGNGKPYHLCTVPSAAKGTGLLVFAKRGHCDDALGQLGRSQAQ